MINTICICGAGTMGRGIAQSAAQSGFHTIVFDSNTDALKQAALLIGKSLDKLVQKKAMGLAEKEKALRHIQYCETIQGCIADIFIEAIAENEDQKIALFNQLAEINHSETIFATNTSSLSVSSIARGVNHPQRVVGMHFFNPAPVMKLVEVVKGETTSSHALSVIMQLARDMGKTPVLCKDSPGFIVNRVARPYYLEALRLAEEKDIAFSLIDELMESTGFKMGPFRLMDFIGNDINLSVTESLYQSSGQAPRFQPSALQVCKVADGELGIKAGKGFYSYQNH